MGQNGSSSADRRMSASDFGNLPPSTEFGENPSATRRFTGRRHSTLGSKSTPNAVGHRRATSTASGTISAAQRANQMTSHSSAPRGRNLASPVPVARTNNNAPPAYSVDSEFGFKPPETILEAPRVNNLVSPGAENALELLKGYDTVFLIDDSGSMAGGLWREACQALAGVAGVAAQYDDDGIDIYFLNSREHVEGVKNADEVRALFTRVQPRGSTPTGARLDNLLRAYLASIERAQQEYDSSDPEVTGIKPINYIVITDGAPTDDPESVIVAAARRLDKGEFPLSQLGIQFVQIGSDPEATAALEELDDDLSGRYGIRDIVDTTPYSARLDGETLIKILLGGVNKRVDRRGGAAVLR